MPDGVNEIRALPLFQILGGPLVALVQAEAQAAKTTAEFVETVGFIADPKERMAGRLGTLRMVAFGYQKADEDGKLVEFQVQVPALALFTIPSLSIKNATVDLATKVSDVYQEPYPTSSLPIPSPKERLGKGWLYPQRTEMRGTVASGAPAPDAKVPPGDITFHLEVARADPSVGLDRKSVV